MANASGFFAPSVPRLRGRLQPAIGINRSGFYSFDGIPKKVFCFSAIERAEKHASSVSPSESRIPRLVSKGCKLVGCGSAVLTVQIYNDDLSKMVTSGEWISVRTGIRKRRVLSDNLTNLAVGAAGKTLQMAEVDPDHVDQVLLCTSTPEDLFGSAPRFKNKLAAKEIHWLMTLQLHAADLCWV